MQCQQYKVKTNNSTEKHERKTWRIVRVFVSSTFTDFFNEREILVKRVRIVLARGRYNRIIGKGGIKYNGKPCKLCKDRIYRQRLARHVLQNCVQHAMKVVINI